MARAATILAIGDSWNTANYLQSVFTDHGEPHTVLLVGIWNSNSFRCYFCLQDLTQLLEENPDARVVQISSGINDSWWREWEPAMKGSQQETNLLRPTIENISVAVDHMLGIRPDMQFYWSSYDYFRPIPEHSPNYIGTPEQMNGVVSRLHEMMAEYAASMPQVTFGNFDGFFQVSYGFDGVQHTPFDPPRPIPAGDPSLPDPKLPSPAVAFEDNFHPTDEGSYRFANAQYEDFYRQFLIADEFKINPGLNDAWLNEDTVGQGFFIIVFPDAGIVFLAWFTYDTDLPPEEEVANLGWPGHRWVTAQGLYVGDTAVLDVFLTEGGVFDMAEPQPVTGDPIGTIVIVWQDCEQATLTYAIDPPGVMGEIPIRRIVPDNVALCEALTGED